MFRLGCFTWVLATMVFAWPLHAIGLGIFTSICGGVLLTHGFEVLVVKAFTDGFKHGAQDQERGAEE